MAKSYKKKREIEEVVETEALSKKEQYDLEKEKRIKDKEKKDKKKNSKKKRSTKKAPTNLGAKIFAVLMLLLMIGSVIVSSLAPIFQ